MCLFILSIGLDVKSVAPSYKYKDSPKIQLFHNLFNIGSFKTSIWLFLWNTIKMSLWFSVQIVEVREGQKCLVTFFYIQNLIWCSAAEGHTDLKSVNAERIFILGNCPFYWLPVCYTRSINAIVTYLPIAIEWIHKNLYLMLYHQYAYTRSKNAWLFKLFMIFMSYQCNWFYYPHLTWPILNVLCEK